MDSIISLCAAKSTEVQQKATELDNHKTPKPQKLQKRVKKLRTELLVLQEDALNAINTGGVDLRLIKDALTPRLIDLLISHFFVLLSQVVTRIMCTSPDEDFYFVNQVMI